jgi:hypothetical protein
MIAAAALVALVLRLDCRYRSLSRQPAKLCRFPTFCFHGIVLMAPQYRLL